MKKIGSIMICLILLVGCNTVSQEDNDKLKVVATTTMIKDLVEVVGGDKVDVTGLMVAGVDPHMYKAKPSDVRAIQNADVIVFNGVHLEAKLDDVLTNLYQIDKNTIKLEDTLTEEDLVKDEEQGGYDPHIWFDVDIWKRSASYVAEKLSEYDPENKHIYTANAEQYLLELDALSAYGEARIALIPEDKRILVTAHDAFEYFGRYFGFQVEAIQGISTASEAGIADINNVASLIVDHEIKAIYTESSVPVKTIESLQAAVVDRGFMVEIGGELHSDSLKDNTSYIETYKLNIDTIVDNLR